METKENVKDFLLPKITNLILQCFSILHNLYNVCYGFTVTFSLLWCDMSGEKILSLIKQVYDCDDSMSVTCVFNVLTPVYRHHMINNCC